MVSLPCTIDYPMRTIGSPFGLSETNKALLARVWSSQKARFRKFLAQFDLAVDVAKVA
jgi:hypothetical protein